MAEPIVTQAVTAADRKAFLDLPYRLNADHPNWVPPLKRKTWT